MNVPHCYLFQFYPIASCPAGSSRLQVVVLEVSFHKDLLAKSLGCRMRVQFVVSSPQSYFHDSKIKTLMPLYIVCRASYRPGTFLST